MANVVLKHLDKTYPNGVQAVRHTRHRHYRVVRTTRYNPRTHRYYTSTRRVYY